ncbi:hypothetical protein AURDEDRAFT_115568 [Auricularia subglabra TFB-10046 SS5]|nr:hypothetical protein AURDEDRAFT_115568 [Auricularia subglabra TFB-10046 SS5]
MRRRAAAGVARQPRYARLLAAYSSSPPHVRHASASDTRRSLSFSGTPCAESAWRD